MSYRVVDYFDQDRRGLQNFLGVSCWDHEPLLQELTRQVGSQLGDPQAVLVFDPSGFAKKGTASVGAARQWLGRLGKVDNGQVGIYLGYVAAGEHLLVDVRLYLPKDWASDRVRRAKTGVPRELGYQTRHQLALEMLQARGGALPHAWIAGDDEMGRSSRFRQDLRQLQERYLLAVPSNTTVRLLEGWQPPWSGHGRRPQRPFEQVRDWADTLGPQAWTAVTVGDAERGPLLVEGVVRRVRARAERGVVGAEEVLVVLRGRTESGDWKYDYYLSNADRETPLAEFARVARAAHRIEECLQRAKSEVGLADYEVRSWSGWYHHQTLVLLAGWFLVRETLRGKQVAPALTLPQVRAGLSLLLAAVRGVFDPERVARLVSRRLQRNEEARFYHWKRRNLLVPKRLRPCG